LHPSGVAKSSTSFGWGKGGNVTSAGWQVTLCDPIWHVSSRSGVGGPACKLLYAVLYFTLLLRIRVINADTREQVLKKGTRLGKLEKAEVIEMSSKPSSEEPRAFGVDVIEQMMSSLPKELTKE